MNSIVDKTKELLMFQISGVQRLEIPENDLEGDEKIDV